MAGCGTLLAALVFTTLVSYSYQIKCYECNEITLSRKITVRPKNIFMRDINADCGSFEESKIVECPVESKNCAKVDMEGPGGVGSIHGCGNSKEACENGHQNVDGVDLYCYSCETDGCNGAVGMTAATSLLAITLFIAKLY